MIAPQAQEGIASTIMFGVIIVVGAILTFRAFARDV